MDKKKKNYWFTFFAGIVVALFIIPLLYALGVPTFDIVLENLFGENTIFPAVFSMIVVVLILFLVIKNHNKDS
ncbi:hypothetical protein [Alkalihalobacterium bogoriense]|uniref:hypothetical protein n=1 Tax=Alkalihalobacterium bogoriense TaxID=246272 RepID=UPI0004797C5D|nr:hypothetical protein [Alkalihalobacterium bogoriense]